MDTTDGKGASTLRQLCERYKCSRSFLYAERDRGRLKFSKAGKKVLVLDDDELAWRKTWQASKPKPPNKLLAGPGTKQDGRSALPAFDPKAADMLTEQHVAKMIDQLNDLISKLNLSTPPAGE
jgi:hypothetical protein